VFLGSLIATAALMIGLVAGMRIEGCMDSVPRSGCHAANHQWFKLFQLSNRKRAAAGWQSKAARHSQRK